MWTPSERALFTRRRKEIYEAIHPETRQGGNQAGPSRQFGGTAHASFASDTATRTGRSERDVQRDATRGERIPEPVLAEVRGTALDKGTVLDRLARAPRVLLEISGAGKAWGSDAPNARCSPPWRCPRAYVRSGRGLGAR